MAGNLYGETSAAATKDVYRYCRFGKHWLVKLHIGSELRTCRICRGEWLADGTQISKGDLKETGGPKNATSDKNRA